MAFKRFFFVICCNWLPYVYGCGQLPAGQGRTLSFTVSGFSLPASMVYSLEPGVTSQVSNISTSKQNAETFVRNLLLRSVKEVLYEQGRNSGLFDNVISLILQQLNLDVRYNPLECKKVFTAPTMPTNGALMNMNNCIIVGGTVTNICVPTAANMCMLPANAMFYNAVPPEHLNISGTIMINNIIMANWSIQMWQSVLNRVLQNLASGSFQAYFYGAAVTLRS